MPPIEIFTTIMLNALLIVFAVCAIIFLIAATVWIVSNVIRETRWRQTMTKEEAIKYLVAYACCGIKGAQCEHCPLYEGPGACADWAEDDIFNAILELREIE